jgi:hypothetical protein
MRFVIALAVGYVVGAKSSGEELNQLGRSLKALCETDEFADVVAAARAQAGHSLHQLAAMLDAGPRVPETTGDLVDRVRHLVGRD